jgi:hypothetical protein
MTLDELTRAQRRQMQKLADKIDLVTHADARFFERFPRRQHRVRTASKGEIEQNEILMGEPVWLPSGYRWFTVVRNVADGARMRLFVRYPEGAETDLAEETAKSIFLCAATPRTWEIEAQIRKAVEARAS